MFTIHNNPEREAWKELLKRPQINTQSLETTVRDIFNDIRRNGDESVRKYTRLFDGADLEHSAVSKTEFEQAEKMVSPALKEALDVAKNNIDTFHRAQSESPTLVETSPGITCWRKSVAIDKIGLYIPGGTAPLFSSVLMLGIPAKIAGCKEIVLCTPPNKEGKIAPEILYTAQLVGIEQVHKVGGIQAIAAMTLGTEQIPAVYKLFGPGNQYVTAAKQEALRWGVDIDVPAGPSEVMVVADESSDASFVASDLLSQMEHGADSQVVLLTDKSETAEKVQNAMLDLMPQLQRQEILQKSIDNVRALVFNQTEDIVACINQYAPEHLILSLADEQSIAERIENAGSVFLGSYTPESLGDYASGTNHTLPTNGYARSYSGVSLDSFIKKITFQKASKAGLATLAPHVMQMAAAEQLDAHGLAVSLRLKTL